MKVQAIKYLRGMSNLTFAIVDKAGGLTGSITRLNDGSSYIVGGNNISIVSQSNGSINIGFITPEPLHPDFPRFTLPASASFDVNVSLGSDFYLNFGTLLTSSHITLLTSSAENKQKLTFWLSDTTNNFELRNSSGSIFTMSSYPAMVQTIFANGDWSLFSFKRMLNPYDPRNVSSLIHWYRSDNVVFDENGVSQLTDNVGILHLQQSNSTLRPTLFLNALKGHPSLQFDGTNDFLTSGMTTLVKPLTIVCVFKLNTERGTSGWLLNGVNDFTIPMGVLIAASSSIGPNGRTTLDVTGGDGAELDYQFETNIDQFGFSMYVFDGSNSSITNNGQLLKSGTTGHSDEPNGILLGGIDASTVGPFDVVELLIFNKNLNSSERDLINSYCSKKYDINT